MPTEVIRCPDCNAALKAVPSWLATASVKFTCINCPKKPSRGLPRYEAAPEPRAQLSEDGETELDDVEIEDLDEDVEIEDVPTEDAEEPSADKDS